MNSSEAPRPGPAMWRKEMQGRRTRTHSRDGRSWSGKRSGKRSECTSLPAEHIADCRSRSRDVRSGGSRSGGSHRSLAQPHVNVLEQCDTVWWIRMVMNGIRFMVKIG